jgi:hypothetical protein
MAITKVTSSVLSSGSATDGYVLTADGSGNSAWEAAAGGIAGIVSSADATAITIDSSENVGIGTTSPVAPVTINDKATISFNSNDFSLGHHLYYDSVADRWERLSSSAGSALYQTAGTMVFYRTTAGGSTGDAVTPSESIRISSAGRVGIGTTNPEQVLHVYQAGDGKRPVRFTTGNNHDLDFYNDTDGWQLISEKGINLSSKNGGELRFTTSSNRRMTIDTSGNIGAPTGTNIYNASDERLKQNISTLSNSLDVINALNPVQFNWIDNFEESENGKNLYGFVAQEVQDVFPDAVESFGTGNDIEVDGTVIENPLTVRDKFFIPVLVKAMQEQQTIIESLEARITALES